MSIPIWVIVILSILAFLGIVYIILVSVLNWIYSDWKKKHGIEMEHPSRWFWNP